MAVNKRLLQGAAGAAGGLVPSEHFGVVLYEGDGSSSHSINGGKFGAGAYIDSGTSSYINLGAGSSFASGLFNGKSTFSVSIWFRKSSSSLGYIFNDYANNSLNVNISILASGTMQVFTRYSSGDTIYNSTTTYDDDNWHHVVVTLDQTTGVRKSYIDGTLVDTQTTSSNSWNGDSDQRITIGALYYTPGDYYQSSFDGKIDQLRVFTKALTSSQVSTLYAETVDTVESLDPLNVDTTDTLQVLGDSSCVATYRFENDEVDLSGNYNGTGTAIQYAAGRYGQAASFDGSSSYVDLGSNMNLSGNSFSFSFWYANTETTSGGDVNTYVIGDLDTTDQTNKRLHIGRRSFNQKLTFAFNGNDMYSATNVSTDGTWQFWTCTFNASNQARKIYLNGVLDQSQTASANYTGTANITIGKAAHSNSYAKGRIDQVRVFNKEISAAEVTTLYQENSLVASYRFEGNANDDTRNYDGTASNVTYEYGLGFQPDLVWLKQRDGTAWHTWIDSTRGGSKRIVSNSTNAETTDVNRLTSFDTGGFTLGSDGDCNGDGKDFVAWCWKANGGTTTSGSGTRISNVVNQVNSAAGFSITTFTGANTTPTDDGNFTHGLGEVPDMFIVKTRNNTDSWFIYHKDLNGGAAPQDYAVRFTNAAEQDNVGFWNDTAPSNTHINVGGGILVNNWTYVCYAFKGIDGFSKFGSYTGNGSANGPIVETGFEPAFLMIKRTDTTANWRIVDNKRSLINPRQKVLFPNLSNAESDVSADAVNFLSNGFEIINNDTSWNASGGTYIYMAFAADPDTEAPTVAKSFSTVTYTGNSTSNRTIDTGFDANFIWIKKRNASESHVLVDSLRPGSELYSNATNAESYYADNPKYEKDSNGFIVGNTGGANASGNDYVAWAWKADDNEPTINTEGSINSLVSANANAGFSIVKYEGNGTAGATIGHGLSAAPEMIIVKALEATANSSWAVYHTGTGNTKVLVLNTSSATDTNVGYWNNTSPTASTFTLGTYSVVNENAKDYIAYCFHSVSNYSKFGSYTGNGGSNSITGLGFQPDFVMIKSTGSGSWFFYDSVRSVSVGDNAGTANARPYILANTSGKENGATSYNVDLDSNGFSMNTSAGDLNTNGTTYIYMAFKIN